MCLLPLEGLIFFKPFQPSLLYLTADLFLIFYLIPSALQWWKSEFWKRQDKSNICDLKSKQESTRRLFSHISESTNMIIFYTSKWWDSSISFWTSETEHFWGYHIQNLLSSGLSRSLYLHKLKFKRNVWWRQNSMCWVKIANNANFSQQMNYKELSFSQEIN